MHVSALFSSAHRPQRTKVNGLVHARSVLRRITGDACRESTFLDAHDGDCYPKNAAESERSKTTVGIFLRGEILA